MDRLSKFQRRVLKMLAMQPWPGRRGPVEKAELRIETIKFGLLSYHDSNLGDDIQAFAALQFMPRVDYFVQRDSIGDFATTASGQRVKIVLNGWFMSTTSWPPAPCLDPLLVSFHVSQYNYQGDKKLRGKNLLITGKSLAYLKEHGPIGCRDISTLQLLEAKGVEAYFSGCLTLTLGSILSNPIDAASREEILIVEPHLDLTTLFRGIPANLRQNASFVSHETPLTGPPELRLSTVSAMLNRYAIAKFVITSRLHCALPCLALGTPVLFVPPTNDLGRLGGLSELLNIARVSDGAIIGPIAWSDPIPNPSKHLTLVEHLSTACRRFVSAG